MVANEGAETNETTNAPSAGDTASPISSSCSATALVGTPMTPLAHMLGDKDVHEMSSAELSNWMERQGAKQETLAVIQYQGMTGEEFVCCFDPSIKTEDAMNEAERALKMDDDMFLRNRCRNKVRKECEKNERQRRIDDETKLQYDRNEAEDRAQAQRIERQQIANDIAKTKEEDAKAQQRQLELEHAERMYALKMKMEGSDSRTDDKITVRMPLAPKMKNVVDGITGDAWDKFETGMKTYAKFNLEEAGKIYAVAFDNPNCNIIGLIEDSSDQFKQMDMAIFTQINEKSSENIMQFIGDIEECQAGGHYSGAMVCANVAKIVNHRSAGKRVKMAELISKQQPVVDARDVKERLIAFNKQLAECKKNGIQVGEEHIYLGLERMIEPLLTRPCLTMEMGSVMHAIGTRRGEYKPLKEALLAIANDLTELPGSKALPRSHNPFQEAEAYSCCCIPQEHIDEISDGPGFDHE
jgi:hypothetical protein